MEMNYEVMLGKQPVGKVQVISQGLYCRIICRCQIPGDQIYRLYVVCGSHRENLGVPVPEGDGFLLDRKVPAKRLGTGPYSFVLSCGAGVPQGTFIPICPEEPFLYIDRLNHAFLESRQGKVGIRTEIDPEAV